MINQFVKFEQKMRVRDDDKPGGSWHTFKCEGLLLDWGLDTDENMGSWSCGIVEFRTMDLEDKKLLQPIGEGEIFLIPVTNIKLDYSVN